MPRNDYFGGIANILSQYKSENMKFKEKGILIDFFDYYNPIAERLLKIKIGHFVYFFLERKAIKKYINNQSVNILHIHTSKKWLLFKDLQVIRYIKKNCSCKCLISIHFADIENITYNYPLIKNIELKIIKKYVDGLVLLSKKTGDEFCKYGILREKIHILYTFHNFYVNNDMIDETGSVINLLFMGSIDKRKGIIDLLRALKCIKEENYILHICGEVADTSITDNFNSLCEDLDNKIIFEGYVKGERKNIILKESDILILPSYGEGMPIVIMEAMSFGCSIISTNVGAIPEIIHSDNGALIEPGDTEGLVNAILERINNKELLDREKKNNAKYAKQFSITENINELCELYKRSC